MPISDWTLVDSLLGNTDALENAYPETLEFDDRHHLLTQLNLCSTILDSVRNPAQTKAIIERVERMQWVGPLWKQITPEVMEPRAILHTVTPVLNMMAKLCCLYPSINIHTLLFLSPPGSLLLPRLASTPATDGTTVSISNLGQYRSADNVIVKGHNDDKVRVYTKQDVLDGPKRQVIFFLLNLFSYCNPIFIQRVISVYNLKNVVLMAQKYLHCMPIEMQDEFAFAMMAMIKRNKLYSMLDYYSELHGANIDKGHLLELGPIPVPILISTLKLSPDIFYAKSFFVSRTINTYFEFIRPLIAGYPYVSQLFQQRSDKSRDEKDDDNAVERRQTTIYDILVLNGYSFERNGGTYGEAGPITTPSGWIHRTAQSSAAKLIKMLCSIINVIFMSNDFAGAKNLVTLFRFVAQTCPSSVMHISRMPFFAKNNRHITNSEDSHTLITYLQLVRILIASAVNPTQIAAIESEASPDAEPEPPGLPLGAAADPTSNKLLTNNKFDLGLCLHHAQTDSDLKNAKDAVIMAQNQEIEAFQEGLAGELLTLVPPVLRPDVDRILLQGPRDRYPEHILAVTTGGGFFSFSYTLLNSRLSKMYTAVDGFYAFMKQSLDKIRKIVAHSSKQTKVDGFANYISSGIPEEHVPKVLIKYFPTSFGIIELFSADNSKSVSQFLSLGLVLEVYAATLKQCMRRKPDMALFSAARRLLPSLLSIRGQVERIMAQTEKSCTNAGKEAEETAERSSLISVYLNNCFSNIALLYSCAFGPLSLYCLNDGKWIPQNMASTEGYVDLSIMKLDLFVQRRLYHKLDNCQLGILIRRFMELIQTDLAEELASEYTVLMAGFMALAVGEQCRFSLDLANAICTIFEETNVLLHPSAHKFVRETILERAGQLSRDELCRGAAKVLKSAEGIRSAMDSEDTNHLLRSAIEQMESVAENDNILTVFTLLAIQKQMVDGRSTHAAVALLHLLNMQSCLRQTPPLTVTVAFPLEVFVKKMKLSSDVPPQSLAFSNALLIDEQIVTRYTNIERDSPLHKKISQCFILLRNMLYWEDILFTEVLSLCINFLTVELPGHEPSTSDEPTAIEDLVSILLSFLLLNIYALAAANNPDATSRNCIFLGRYQLCRSKLLNRCIDLMRSMDLSSSCMLADSVSETTVQRMIPSQNIDRIGACIPLQLEYTNILLSKTMHRASASIKPLLIFTTELFAHIYQLYLWKDISVVRDDKQQQQQQQSNLVVQSQANVSQYQVIIDAITKLVPQPVAQHTANFMSSALSVLLNIKLSGANFAKSSPLYSDILEKASYPILINSSALLGTETGIEHFIFVPYMHVLLFMHNGTIDSLFNIHAIQLFSVLCQLDFSLEDIYGYEPSEIYVTERNMAAIAAQTQMIKDAIVTPENICFVSSIYPTLAMPTEKYAKCGSANRSMDPILYSSALNIDCKELSTRLLAVTSCTEKRKEAVEYIKAASKVLRGYSVSSAEMCPVLFGDIYLEFLLDPCTRYEAAAFKNQARDLHNFAPAATAETAAAFDELPMFSFEEPERIIKPEKIAYRPNTNFDKEYADLQYKMRGASHKLPNRLYACIQNSVVPEAYKMLTYLALRMAPDSLVLAPEASIVTVSQLFCGSITSFSTSNTALPILPLLLLCLSGDEIARPGGPLSHLFSDRYTSGIQLMSLLFIAHGYDAFRPISSDILTRLLAFLDMHRMENHPNTRIVPLGFVPAKVQAFRYHFVGYCRHFQDIVATVCSHNALSPYDKGRALRYLGFLSSSLLAYIAVAMPSESFDKILATEAYSSNPLRLLRKMANREFRLAQETDQDELLLRTLHRNHSIFVKYCFLDIDGIRALATALDYRVIYNECSKVRCNMWKLNDLVEQEHEIVL